MSEQVWPHVDAAFREVDKAFQEAGKAFDEARKLGFQQEQQTGRSRYYRCGCSDSRVIPLTFKNRLTLIRLAFSFAKKVRI